MTVQCSTNTIPWDHALAERLRELDTEDNPERAHGEADEILVKLVRTLGYNETADAFIRMKKWYS